LKILLEPTLILFFALGLLVLFLLGWLLLFPLRKLLKLALNSILGACALALLNYLGTDIPINAFSCILTGLFGIPAIVVLFILSLL